MVYLEHLVKILYLMELLQQVVDMPSLMIQAGHLLLVDQGEADHMGLLPQVLAHLVKETQVVLALILEVNTAVGEVEEQEPLEQQEQVLVVAQEALG
jgi:hypothetical protein